MFVVVHKSILPCCVASKSGKKERGQEGGVVTCQLPQSETFKCVFFKNVHTLCVLAINFLIHSKPFLLLAW